jgi:hypothetical protein|nr:MAG TPA: acetyltransferase domain containing protein [Caudoviricetes sp.]
MEKIIIKEIKSNSLLSDEIRISALLNNKEVGHIIISENSDESNFDENLDDKAVYDSVIKLLDDYGYFYTLDYLYVNEGYRGAGIGRKLLYYWKSHYGTKPTILHKSSYSMPDEQTKKLMNNKILPNLYREVGFKQIKNTNYFCNK